MTTFHGVDLYHGNEITGALPAMEVFVHKLSEGASFKDPKAADRLSAARMFAVRRGGYHWLRSDSTVKQQIANFQIAISRTTLVSGGELVDGAFLMTDFERTFREVNGELVAIPDPPVEMVEEFEDAVIGLYGDRHIVYASDWVNTFKLWRYRNPTSLLWYANYVTDPKRADGGPQECVKWNATCWQYTNKAVVPGMAKPCDSNTILNFAELDRICHRHAPAPKPAPKPTPVLEDDIMNALITVQGDPAQFLGQVNKQGAALVIEWTGPGSDPAVPARIAAHRKAGLIDQGPVARADLKPCTLIGPVPPGWTVADFARVVS